MNFILERSVSLLSAIYQESRSIPWRFVKKIGRPIVLNVHSNLQFKFLPSGYITKLIYRQQLLVRAKKSFEYATLSLIRSIIKPDFIILDIGANIGLHSLVMAASLSEKGKIYAFEPIKKTYDILSENVRINGLENKIALFNIGLSDRNGMIDFSIPSSTTVKEDDLDAFYAINYDQNILNESAKVATLDTWISTQNIQKVDLIKIDVEGAELLCFQGAVSFFETHKPIIIMECQESHLKRFDHSIFELLQFLSQFGYAFEEISDHNWMASPTSAVLNRK
jgi:FkbM family methyltransferase